MCERFCAAVGRWRLAGVTAVFVVALQSLAPAPAAADDGHRLRVMTQNLYVGSFFQELTGATTADVAADAEIKPDFVLAGIHELLPLTYAGAPN